MNRVAIILAGISLVLAVLSLLQGVYIAVPVSIPESPGAAIVINRFTGSARMCGVPACIPLQDSSSSKP